MYFEKGLFQNNMEQSKKKKKIVMLVQKKRVNTHLQQIEKNVKKNITKERKSYEYQQCKNAKSMSYNNELLPIVNW